jgi:AraC family transcriptional regulator
VMRMMAGRNIFNKSLRQILRPPDERAPIIKTIERNPLSATRCMLDVPFDSITNSLPRDDAYMIVIQIQGKTSRELWLDGKPVKTEPLYAGGVVFHDLRQSVAFYFNDPLDSVNYFLPRKTLDAIADDIGAPRIGDLRFIPGVGVMDRVVAQLTRLLLPAFDKPDQTSRLFAEHISLALGSHIAETYGGKPQGRYLYRGCRQGVFTLGRTFRPRVSADHGSIATPVAASATN